jgi:hypothetical protein
MKKSSKHIAAEDLFQIQTSYRRPEPNKLGNILHDPKNLWNKTGFKESPYDTKPLKV